MKRGFEDCSELKETCGSQFLQYLAKTALASQVALNEKKLAIYKKYLPLDGRCAGCNMPDGSARFSTLTCVCGQLLKCGHEFCQGRELAHQCATCQRYGDDWCNEVEEVMVCSRCDTAICSEKCKTNCVWCLTVCQPCAGPTELYVDVLDHQYDDWRQYLHPVCALHKAMLVTGEEIIASCKQCCDSENDPQRCSVSDCCAFYCPHDDTDNVYCKKHATVESRAL